MQKSDLSFQHEFIPAERADPHTLLLLHGTGGNERDLLDIGRLLSPTTALLSPRGKVLERGMPRFFRRLAEGVFDIPDLKARAAELATFITDACQLYKRDPSQIIAVGFSNGANIAAGLMLLSPNTLRGAILLRAMIPFQPDPLPSLTNTAILLSAGSADPMVTGEQTEKLAALLQSTGASVELHWERAGHTLTQGDLQNATRWLNQLPT